MSDLHSDASERDGGGSGAAVSTVLVPKPRDLGGFQVRRALPAATCRAVGPFVFFDQMGPATFAAGQAVDVRPHPHIGLATVTWLTEGEILHADSLGYVQPIRPGELNWMTAGSGIVHSERTPGALRGGGARLAGIQAWLALPREHEETAPAFEHYAADRMPRIQTAGVRGTLIAGEAFGERSPVSTYSQTLYLELRLDTDAAVDVPADAAERALYLFDGEVAVDGTRFDSGRMLVLERGRAVRLTARRAAHVFVLGGEPLDGPRHLWWNFVSSSQARIEQAKADWQGGRFASVPGDDEFIPLPER